MGKGRPKVELDLPKGWKEDIISLYKDGASDVEVKAMIYDWRGSFSDDLFYRWMKEEPDFSGTIKRGRALSRAWWERTGRLNMQNKDFSYTGWYMNMKNRFGWADKQSIDHTTQGEKFNAIEVKIINPADPVTSEDDINEDI